MKNKLKQITDLTIQEVLGNEIILPSTYFKTFDKNIKKILETFYLNNSGRIFTKRGLIDTLLQLILK